MRVRARVRGATLLFALQLLRLRVDRVVGDLFRRQRPRVVATACWSFPIYSQTFVYQELTQLIRGGFSVRFLYSNLDRTHPLPSQFRRLWRARRRLLLEPAICEQSYAYFAARIPERIQLLVDVLGRASGLSPDAILSHYHFRQAFAFARMIEAYRPDYLHSYFFYEGSLFALVASSLLDIPRGVSCYADHMLDDYALKVVAFHLRESSIIVATSQRIKNELLSIEPAAASGGILVKPNGINVKQFPYIRRRDLNAGQPFRLVCLCRIEPKKGLLYLLDAVGQLRDRGTLVHLHVVGGVDDSPGSREYYNQVKERIEGLALSDVVHLEGRRSEPEINSFFKASHLFVAPFVETAAGDKDGVPTALLEAMASGLPVIATDAGSILEVVDHGCNGLIVPQRDAEGLANAIATLMADAKRRSELGDAAARTARHRFDASTCEQVFHERLMELLASNNASAPRVA